MARGSGGRPGVDRPDVDGEAVITLPGRGVSVTGRVEAVVDGAVVVRPSAGDYVRQAVVAVGDPVEVSWQGPGDTRIMPAAVIAVEQGALVRWRLRPTGPAEASQRREAVRGRVVIPLEAGVGRIEMKGQTVDLSETGTRILLEGFGPLPAEGSAMDLRLELEDGALYLKAQVVRAQERGDMWALSMRFVDIEERLQDRVRRRVFQALREERARRID